MDLANVMLGVHRELGEITTRLTAIEDTLGKVLVEQKRTNGRVTRLETRDAVDDHDGEQAERAERRRLSWHEIWIGAGAILAAAVLGGLTDTIARLLAG